MLTEDPELLLWKKNLLNINPLRYGEERHDANQSFGPFKRQYYLLHYVDSGKGTYHTPSGPFEVSKGQIFVIFPGETTTYAANKQDPWHYFWVGFESSINLTDIFSSYVITAPDCAHIFHAIVYNSGSFAKKEWYICGKIFELLTQLGNRPDSCQNKAESYVLIAKKIIAANYSEHLKIDKIAGNLGLSSAYFSRIFHKYTGKTPQRYIVDFRLDKAAELLICTQLTPSEIAHEVGYFDTTNFSRMFSRKYGIPPSKYRKKVGGTHDSDDIQTCY